MAHVVLKLPCLLSYGFFHAARDNKSISMARLGGITGEMSEVFMKTYTVISDIKRSLCGKNFFIGVAGMMLVIALSSLESIITVAHAGEALPSGYHVQLVTDALSADWVTLALPILCTLPFTAAFVDDIKSGFIKQYLHRAGNAQYIKGKLIACGLSGGLVLLIGIILAYGISVLVFMPMELALGLEETATPYLAQLLKKAAMLFFSGTFWSLTGFTFAALAMNKYIAYASPFILYYVLIILNERYFKDLYVLYPKEWLSPSEFWVMGSFGVILLLAAFSVIVCLGFTIVARRRLANV
jgi:hypothetical protein